LQETLVQLMNRLSDETRRRILENDTVVLGLVIDEDGDPHLVYTVAGNRTYRELTTAAQGHGLPQWKPRARVEGEREGGGPGDAGQLMIEGGLATGWRVAGMAVTRTVCEDCKAAAAEAEKGGIPIVKVDIPIPKTARRRRRGPGKPKGPSAEAEGGTPKKA